MWERHEVEVFLTLAEELHFGRTATRLRLTTGRVSQTVKKLEHRVGAPLFERTSRVVRLTPIGRRLAEDLAPIVADLQKALDRATEAGRGVTGVLRVGFMGAGTEQLLLKAVGLFTSRHPDCEVRIRAAQMVNSRPYLLDGSIDLVIAGYPYPGMACGPALLSEPRMLAVSADHPLARQESVSLEVLADHPVIQLPADLAEEFRQDRTPSRTPSGRPVRQGPVGHGFAEILTLVALGRGAYPVGENASRYHPRPDIAYVPIHDAPPVRWGPVWLEANSTARVLEFVSAAVDANCGSA
ncbi:LysR family transcriptional regulator [Saccharothrix sp. ST-888]|nr:LysR family transcriptional regulator [Saccharothrix sp. ST-888]